MIRCSEAAAVAGAVVAFIWSSSKAAMHEVSAAETQIFRKFNGAPASLQPVAWPLMQSGSLLAVFAAAAVETARFGALRGRRLAVGGTMVWLVNKLVKQLVSRGRPDVYLDDVVVRGEPQRGSGFPSGHAAVATTLALATTRQGRGRIAAIAVASLTGGGRMYSGAHLPLDVAGGFSIGVLGGKTLRHWLGRDF